MADATSITLKDSKHICSKEHLHIMGLHFLSVSYPISAIGELSDIFHKNSPDILIVQNLHTEDAHSRTHTCNFFSKDAIKNAECTCAKLRHIYMPIML